MQHHRIVSETPSAFFLSIFIDRDAMALVKILGRGWEPEISFIGMPRQPGRSVCSLAERQVGWKQLEI